MDDLLEKRIIFVLACLSCFTISFNTAAISAVIPAISASLARPDIIVSRIISFYMIPYGLGALLYAPLTRFFTYRVVLVVTMILYAAACVVSGAAKSYLTLAGGCVVMGIAAASVIPLGLMVIGEVFPKELRGRMVGLFFGSSFIASLGGIALSGVVEWPYLFFVPAFLAIIVACLYSLLRLPQLARTHMGSVDYLSAWKNKRLRNIFLFILLISLFYHGVQKWFGVFLAAEYGLDKFKISLFFMIMAVASFVGQVAGGWLTDKMGRKIACQTGLVGLSLGTMILACHFHQDLFLALALCLFSMSWTVGHSGISTVLTDYADHERPITASLNSAVRFISGGIGFYLSGFLVKFSFGLTFLSFGIAILALTGLLNRVVSGR